MLAVLGMCSPSYGYILVYKFNSTVKVVDDTSETAMSIPVKGYLAVDLSDEDESPKPIFETSSNYSDGNKSSLLPSAHCRLKNEKPRRFRGFRRFLTTED